MGTAILAFWETAAIRGLRNWTRQQQARPTSAIRARALTKALFLSWLALLIFVATVGGATLSVADLGLGTALAWLALDNAQYLPFLDRLEERIYEVLRTIVFSAAVPFFTIGVLFSPTLRVGSNQWYIAASAALWITVVALGEYVVVLRSLRRSWLAVVFVTAMVFIAAVTRDFPAHRPRTVSTSLWLFIWAVFIATLGACCAMSWLSSAYAVPTAGAPRDPLRSRPSTGVTETAFVTTDSGAGATISASARFGGVRIILYRALVRSKRAGAALVVFGGAAGTYLTYRVWPDPTNPAVISAVLCALVLLVALAASRQLEAWLDSWGATVKIGVLILVAGVVAGIPTVYSVFPSELSDRGQLRDWRFAAIEVWAVVALLALLRTAARELASDAREEAEKRRLVAITLERFLDRQVQRLASFAPPAGPREVHWFVLVRRSLEELGVAYPLEGVGRGAEVKGPCLARAAIAAADGTATVGPTTPLRMQAGDSLLVPTALNGTACVVVDSTGTRIGAVVAYSDPGRWWNQAKVLSRCKALASYVGSPLQSSLGGLDYGYEPLDHV